MSIFNFDSETNIVNNKIPSVKSINKNFCKNKGSAGLWIADENMEACEWKKACKEDCDFECKDHYVNTKIHIIQGLEEEIYGRGIINNRILVIRRTPLLKVTNDKNIFSGLWVKGDGEIKDSKGLKKYSCVRKYLIMFLDEENIPLHSQPLQLTAKGIFQIQFDQNLLKFRNDIKNVYAKVIKKRISSMSELWYSMCIFAPTFESKLVGSPPLQSNACSVKSFEIPQENNWISLCVGRNPEVNEIVNLLYHSSEQWYNKFQNNTSTQYFDEEETASNASN